MDDYEKICWEMGNILSKKFPNLGEPVNDSDALCNEIIYFHCEEVEEMTIQLFRFFIGIGWVTQGLLGDIGYDKNSKKVFIYFSFPKNRSDFIEYAKYTMRRM